MLYLKVVPFHYFLIFASNFKYTIMATIKIVLRDNKVDKSGKAPLYLRVTKDRKSRFISIGIKVEPKFWDEDEMKVKKGFPNSQRTNAFIRKKLSEAEDIILDESVKNKLVSTKQLKQFVVGKEPTYFFAYATNYLEANKHRFSYPTYSRYTCILNVFKTYSKTKDLTFDEINKEYIQKYETYMLNRDFYTRIAPSELVEFEDKFSII